MSKNALLRVRDVSVGYGDNVILNDIFFDIAKGELVGIIGANGTGKSTLLKVLRGLLPRLSGEIRLYEKNIDELTEREFALAVAYMGQNLEINFNYTAREIVLTGRYPHLTWWQREGAEDEDIVSACLEYVGVDDQRDRALNNMSGGQRQRVLLAKTLAQQTPLIFLDEPMSGLDLVYQEDILRFCQELCSSGKTILLVIHELHLAARFCSRLLLLGSGQLLADDLPNRVINELQLQRAYSSPIKVEKNPLTDHLDIFSVSNDISERRQQLLQRILK